MARQIEIRTFEDLVDFIENNDLTPQQIDKIVTATLGGVIAGDYSKEELVDTLKKYWAEYGGHRERPIFIDKEDFEN